MRLYNIVRHSTALYAMWLCIYKVLQKKANLSNMCMLCMTQQLSINADQSINTASALFIAETENVSVMISMRTELLTLTFSWEFSLTAISFQDSPYYHRMKIAKKPY